jgi:pimeloyl-ACP methyl ester carboxylesterase
MKEHPLRFGTSKSLIGILTQGDAAAGTDRGNHGLTAILFNAGLIHHVGPNRIYVALARTLAAMGIPTLRFDLSGIGDSGPRRDKLPAKESMQDDARQVMDALERDWGAKRFLCIGLCAGAAVAAQVALADRRVQKLIMINPLLPVSAQTTSLRHSNYYYSQALFNPRSWLKFIFLRSHYRSIVKAIWLKITEKLPALRAEEDTEIVAMLRAFFYHLKTTRMPLLMLFSEDDIGEQYFRSIIGEEYNLLRQSGQIKTTKLAGADHLVTPLISQHDLMAVVTDWLRETV